MPLNRRRKSLLTATLALAGAAQLACGSSGGEPPGSERNVGQSDFVSAPPYGNGRLGAGDVASGAAGNGGGSGANPPAAGPTRAVEETDLYRLDGDRLYFLNAYRGLMVFDVSNVDAPRLLGRSPMFGSPVEMIVRDGIAVVVMTDWYGAMEDGTPFHGSIVRGLDARDPGAIAVLGEAQLGGWVRDTRVVGDVLYTVTEDYGWVYDSETGTSTSGTAKAVIDSVAFAGGVIQHKGRYAVPGSGGIFNVTPSSILFAHDLLVEGSSYQPSGRAELEYIDISDPLGTIRPRGKLTIDGSVQSWGTDNGRWNIDFSDGVTARALACANAYCDGGAGYALITASFENPDAPAELARLAIAGSGWQPAARFDGPRMYLSPGNSYWSSGVTETPIQIYDLSDPAAPALAGSASITGTIWNFTPAGDRLFALGSRYDTVTGSYSGSSVALHYLDVSNAAQPTLLGSSSFGEGWAWTPAAGTFKAFTKRDDLGLVVLPFSGWSNVDYNYNNGLQLIQFTPDGLTTAGAAKTRGWVERGIFVGNRLISLSDLALSVVDYTNPAQPTVVSELTLARNVVDAAPQGDVVVELSTDWWGNPGDHSELRVLPIAGAEESTSGVELASVAIEGSGASAFHNGSLSYVITRVLDEIPCADGVPAGQKCWSAHQQVQVVDTSDGTARLRGKLELPGNGYGYGYYGYWGGCYAYDWYYGSSAVQVGGDALAMPRFEYSYDAASQTSSTRGFVDVIDLSNPDAPSVATVALSDGNPWWGNLKVVGGKLYLSHYEWFSQDEGRSWLRYFLDEIDVSDRSAPRLAAKINVPGLLVGGSASDPNVVYTMDYRWYGDQQVNELAVLRLSGDKAYLQSKLGIPGWVGSTFVQGNRAYFTAERYLVENDSSSYVRELHEVDLSDPQHPVDRVNDERKTWGWLLGLEGDRLIMTSGWSGAGIDIYRLSAGSAPVLDRFVRTLGWGGTTSLARQGQELFLASGHWGIQRVPLD